MPAGRSSFLLLLLGFGALALAPAARAEPSAADPLYQFQPGQETRWVSPENPTGEKGAGGRENRGAKGHAFETIPAGRSHVLADVQGPGVIDRIWMTIDDRSPERLRALKLEIFWDGAAAPAVSVPLGDFFLHGAGEMTPMETALLASPEGRSFVSYIPMPFRTRARVVVTNESAKDLNLIFYDVDYRRLDRLAKDALYFHASWRRERPTRLGESFKVLPRVQGRGRFLGASVTVLTDPSLEKSWWGEGEAKIYLDGDRSTPSLAGTGTEDYIGTAWGQGAYVNRFQGAPVADEPRGRWTFYRFHVPDPIFFGRDIEVELQQIGGWPKKEVLRLQAKGAPLRPVTVDPGSRKGFRQLLAGERPIPLTDPSLPDGWTNFYRSDDVSAVAYFYLDRAEGVSRPLAPVSERTAALRPPAEKK
ncbi:MAG TPA: glycoside hydrolase family 172 protein [Caulobacteraceae bacterium]|jgi:hypothetical protein